MKERWIFYSSQFKNKFKLFLFVFEPISINQEKNSIDHHVTNQNLFEFFFFQAIQLLSISR